MARVSFCPPNAKQDHLLYCKGSFLALLLCSLIYELLQQPLEFNGKSPAGLNGIKLYSPPHLFPTLTQSNAFNGHLFFKNVFSSTNMFSEYLNCTFILHSASKCSSRATLNNCFNCCHPKDLHWVRTMPELSNTQKLLFWPKQISWLVCFLIIVTSRSVFLAM